MTRQRETPSLFRKWHGWLVLLLLLGLAGCGKPGQISGTVKYKGKPLPNGSVVFFDSRDRQVGSASIKSDGTYSANLPSGTLKVAIVTPASSQTLRSMPKDKQKKILEGIKQMKKGAFNPLEGENEELIPAKVIAVPAKYAEHSSSGLTLEVLGGPQSFDIDLH